VIPLRGKLRRALIAAAELTAPSAFRRLRLARRLRRYCAGNLTLLRPVIALTVRRGAQAGRHFVAVRRSGRRIEVSCSADMMMQEQDETYGRLCPLLKLVGEAPLSSMQVSAEISDGEASGPGLLSFCTRDSRAILIPDHSFVCSQGYEHYRQLARANLTEWDARSDRIVWRGTTTGVGIIAKDQLSADDTDLILRVRLCLELRGMAGTDVKISAVAQSIDAAADRERLAKAGILGGFIAPIAWYGHRFAIDIDGNSNAWSNLFTRLMMGCCVLKIASPLGYRQWYYDELKAWTHYVPVKADLSDLKQQIAWCRANLDECRQIAGRGQNFAMARSYDTEVASAVDRLTQAYTDGKLRTS
jgi:Glycosyl transferase family 90